MYKRKDNNRQLCLDISHAENRMKIQNEKIENTKQLIQRSMHENFHLFFNVESASAAGHKVPSENNCKIMKCTHNVMPSRVDLIRTVGKSSEDLAQHTKVTNFFAKIKFVLDQKCFCRRSQYKPAKVC